MDTLLSFKLPRLLLFGLPISYKKMRLRVSQMIVAEGESEAII